MKDEASFSQVIKLLGMLNGLDAEQANRILARIGAVAGEVRREGPAPHYNYHSPASVEAAWKVVLKTVDPSKVVITIAHQIYGDHIEDHRCRFQLRCWRISPEKFVRGKAIHYKNGHSSESDLLFETLLEAPPTRNCKCCWQQTLRPAGLTDIGNADEYGSGRLLEEGKPYWRRRVVTDRDYMGEFSFDVLEYAGTGEEESEPKKP